MDRRHFLKAGASLVGAGALVEGKLAHEIPSPATTCFKAGPGRLKQAVGFGMIQEGKSVLEKFRLLKELGFDGVELNAPSPLDLDEVLRARDKTGLQIHGVVDAVHWQKPFSHPDPKVRAQGRAGLAAAIKAARKLGATTVLLVPGVVNAAMPYDLAYTRAQREIKRMLPLAEEARVHIAIENVWNNFLLSPLEAARFVDSFKSPWIGWYLDIGNVVNTGWPEQWVHILGQRILKLHIKGYSRKLRDEQGLWKGFQVEIGEGDCGYPKVMAALKKAGLAPFATAEVQGGNRQRLAAIKARLDKVLI